MPAGEIAEGIFKFIARLVIEVVLEIVCYWVGKVVLRIITLGKYPPPQAQDHSESFVASIGLVTLVGVGMVIFQMAQ